MAKIRYHLQGGPKDPTKWPTAADLSEDELLAEITKAQRVETRAKLYDAPGLHADVVPVLLADLLSEADTRGLEVPRG